MERQPSHAERKGALMVMIVLMTVMRAMMMAIRAMMMRMLCILLVSKVGGLAALAIGSTTAVLAPRFSLIGNIFSLKKK